MDNSFRKGPPPRRTRRWAIALLLAYYSVAFSATIPLFETEESAQSRRSADVHRTKAAACRAAARTARDAEARRLAKTATNHDWFADVQEQGVGGKVTWLTKLAKTLHIEPPYAFRNRP